jgi:ethanolamine utilization protein EutN
VCHWLCQCHSSYRTDLKSDNVNLATVIGNATSTVKHATWEGWRLLVVQPLDAAGRDDGTPLVAIDALGAARGDRVLLTSDGRGVRQMVGAKNTPARWAVIGIVDDAAASARDAR